MEQEKKELDLFGHHMHGTSSAYGSLLLEGLPEENEVYDFMEEVDNREGVIDGLNHMMDYVEIRKRVPEEFNLIFSDMAHFHKSDKLYDDIYGDVKQENGTFRKFPKHVYFDIDGKEAVVINSSEVGITDCGLKNRHFSVTGLEMGYDEYIDMSLDELFDLAKEAEITSPCHPFAPFFYTGKRLLYDFLEETKKGEFGAALNYSTGYTPLINKLSHGTYQKKINPPQKLRKILPEIIREQLEVEKDIIELAEEYNLALLPEIDGHIVLPKKLEGFGVLEEQAMDDFKVGEFPSKKLYNPKIISYNDVEGVSLRDFLNNFPNTFPGWNYEKGIFKSLRKKVMPSFLNYTYEDFNSCFEASLEGLDCMGYDEVIESVYNPLS